jgi:hypothetical protein
LKPILAFLLAFLVAQTLSHGQPLSLLASLKQDTVVDLYLTIDWKEIVKHKREKAYQPAEVLLVKGTSDSIMLPVQVKARGNIRLEICSYPPLKLKFKKSHLAQYNLSGLNEMDIVYPCKQGDVYEQFVLKEYLAYKLWELVSPYAFHTQLIRFHYLQEDGEPEKEAAFGFLVENSEETADRLRGKRVETPTISSKAVEKASELTMSLFQFMIGNTDWNILNRHNLDFLALPGHSLLVTIPYDFDYSGLVGTPYAVPHESLKLSSVTTRYYQGDCFTIEEVNQHLKIFREQKENILAAPYRIQGLNEKSIHQTVTYLNQFFDIIDHPQKLKNQIIKHCGLWPMKN